MNFSFAAPSPDAIAIRVIPNPDHYSPERWYREQGFQGSPQALLVDGYEAIRDGRTVYVNAANIAEGALYTNIYLISYNQSAETATEDIFSQILSHWKFNTNISGVGNCSDNEIACLADADCPDNSYCSSSKARITRDTKRIADLVEIKIALAKYKAEQGQYPMLSAGTYLPDITVSTWPSWQETLAKELKLILPKDPVNQLGDCPEYDQTTCWNEKTKEFADPDTDNDSFELPAGSNAFVYEIKRLGLDTSMSLCGTMESPQARAITEYSCTSYGIENSPPEFRGINLPVGYSGEPYVGYIEAIDPDNDSIGWEGIDTMPGFPWQLWSAPPALSSTSIASQKSIRAAKVGVAGNYDFKITINDHKAGGQITKTFTIAAVNRNLPIISPQADKEIIIGQSLDFTVNAQEADSQYPLTFNVIGLPNNLSYEAVNQHNLRIYGNIIDQVQEYAINIIATDSYLGPGAPIDFTITVSNNPPVISSSPLTEVVGCVDYAYQVVASDPDSHNLQYLATGLPAGLNINSATGEISGRPQTRTNSFSANITVRDQYYSYSDPFSQAEQNFTLNVKDEEFTLTPPDNAVIYVFPSQVDNLAALYYPGVTFFGQATVSTAYPVTYQLSSPPAWLAIDPNTGQIQGTPTNNVNDPNTYDITVTAANNCGVSQANNFTLTVIPNQWCGDSATQTNFTEECDDGANGINTDQCTDQCQKTYCGDGVIQASNGYNQAEQCDDANSSNNDTCLNSCQNAACGDGYVRTGTEQCDDGNATNGDGCNTTTANCQHVCGDGSVDIGEQCDDANSSNNDACRNDCTYAYCGDGIVQTPNSSGFYEQCEANGTGTSASNQYGCTNCQWTGGWCGDGSVNGGEQCDGGNLNGYTCGSYGYTAGSLSCSSSCSFNSSSCCNYFLTFPNGARLQSNSLTATFGFWKIAPGGSGPSGNMALSLGRNYFALNADNGGCDSCGWLEPAQNCDDVSCWAVGVAHYCEGVKGTVTTSHGSYVYTTASNQTNGYDTYDLAHGYEGYVQTRPCGNCCYTQFNTYANVTCEH